MIKTRRDALSILGRAACAACTVHLVSLTGCRGPDPLPDSSVRIPLSELPPGSRVRILFDERPVEVRRRETGVTALSLLCTHMGCEVRWNETARTYGCPCHGGLFDENGEVLAGPPNVPLESLPTRLAANEVFIGE